jgi:perosamine synthetase
MQINMSSPDLTDAEIAAVTQVLQTPILSIGPNLTAFEQAVAAYVGARYAIGVNSGTSGLHLCTIAAGIKEGDLVITTPFSFIASANCIIYEQAVPVFVDVDSHTANIDPVLVAEAVEALIHAGRSASNDRWLPPALRGVRWHPQFINHRRSLESYLACPRLRPTRRHGAYLRHCSQTQPGCHRGCMRSNRG